MNSNSHSPADLRTSNSVLLSVHSVSNIKPLPIGLSWRDIGTYGGAAGGTLIVLVVVVIVIAAALVCTRRGKKRKGDY